MGRKIEEKKLELKSYQDPYNKKVSNKNWLLLLLVPILITCVSFGYKSLKKVGNVTVVEYKFNVDYSVEDATYIFEKGKTVEMDLTLGADEPSKLDLNKLSYSVDDTNICTYNKDANRCFFTGNSNGNTNLKIYYEGKDIKTIKIGFKDNGEEIAAEKKKKEQEQKKKEEEQQKKEDEQKRKEKEKEQQEQQEQDSYYNSMSYIESYIRPTVEAYVTNYPDARNLNDLSYVYPYITQTGRLYNELVVSVPKTYAKGVTVYLQSYSIDKIYYKKGTFRAQVKTEYIINNSSGEKHQREYQEFILVQEGSGFYIDGYHDWKKYDEYYM